MKKPYLLFLIFICTKSFAQSLPEQDCINAIEVIQPVYYQAVPYIGEGNTPNEINGNNSCLITGEKNDVWYKLFVNSPGNLCFSIIPMDSTDDYDWAVFNITNSACHNIFNDSIEVSCNFSPAPGITGPNGDTAFNKNEPCIPVSAGETYVVNVSLFQPTPNGYILDFSASSATFGCNARTLLSGVVYNDLDSNCVFDSLEIDQSNWLIKAEPGPTFGYFSSYTGIYKMCLDSGSYAISLIDNNIFKDNLCSGNGYQIQVGSQQEITGVDFGIRTTFFCPLLSVDISTWALRPCMQSTYTVHYCNHGTIPADSAYIEVEFDNDISPVSSTLPWASQNGNVFTFNIGNVGVNQCGTFYISIDVSCNAVMGSTHCIQAHIYPDSICTPADSSWDHSSMNVEGYCVNDSLACFSVFNTGDDMAGSSQYRIYENNNLVDTGYFQLSAGDSLWLCWPAGGLTIRLEADQRPGHPGNSQPNANVELCGGIPPGAMGFILTMPEDDADEFVEYDCREITASYDPNEKLVKPAGIGSSHAIDSTDVLEYQINFQNTGTDTAFRVVVRDTLSQYLDVVTVRSGAGSHPYTFRIYGHGILEWTFNTILLPDSNTNEPLSHGFVRFNVRQKPGNNIGTIIENRAAIYFDYNAPVITNTAFNTVWKEFFLSSTKIYDDEAEILVYPNPGNGMFAVISNRYLVNEVKIYNILGKEIYRILNTGYRSPAIIDITNQPSGLYIYKLFSAEKMIGAGKLVVE